MPSATSWVETLSSLQADGPALTTNNASTSMLNPQAKPLIKANSLFVGKMFRLQGSGRVTTLAATSSTHAINILIGASNVFTTNFTSATNAGTNVALNFELYMACRAIGNAANFMPLGSIRAATVSISSNLPVTAPAVGGNFDNTIDQLFDLQFLIQTAAITSIQLHQFNFEALN